jgi:hypothetical protein
MGWQKKINNIKRSNAMARPEQSFSADKFKCFVRYMINAAQQKRCVPYYELENLFGLGHEQCGYYAGRLGDYCINQRLPRLNGLIVSSNDCIPSEGFDWYQREYGRSWGEVVSECWKHFHVTSTRRKQVLNFSGVDRRIDAFLRSRNSTER